MRVLYSLCSFIVCELPGILEKDSVLTFFAFLYSGVVFSRAVAALQSVATKPSTDSIRPPQRTIRPTRAGKKSVYLKLNS